jgi:hypothetical protein
MFLIIFPQKLKQSGNWNKIAFALCFIFQFAPVGRGIHEETAEQSESRSSNRKG